jgi:hypothetical protein
MNSPAMPRRIPSVEFGAIVDEFIRANGIQRKTSTYALEIGIRPDELIRYARGERSEGFQELLLQSPWAMERVVALIRAARDHQHWVHHILNAGALNPYDWGVLNTGDRDADLMTLIDQVN